MISPLDALVDVPGVDPGDVDIAELGGGLTNRTYLVSTGQHRLVLRLAADTDAMVLPDRAGEVSIMRAAAAAGIAPGVVHVDQARGVLLTEYVEGTVWQTGELSKPRNLERLAQLLRRTHSLPLCGQRTDLMAMAERYAGFIPASETSTGFASACVSIVREHSANGALACCHNDVVASNVIDAGKLKLIDWEYAGDNDPFFDLASIVAYHDIDSAGQRTLLLAYTGEEDAAPTKRLAQQVRVFDAVQWLWLASRQVNSPQPAELERMQDLRERMLPGLGIRG